MKKTILFRVGIVLVAVIALSWLPQSALAQRGGGHGGGGGGGFHGGGGGGGFHGGGAAFHGGGGFSGGVHSGFVGGRAYGGYHGGYYGGRGYYGGYHGGYGWGGRGYGWGRGYWGGGYGYGWGGWGVGFGWPYWGWGYGYPYGYYYSPGYYGSGPYYSYPPYGPSGDPSGSPDQSNGNGNPQSTDPNARPQPNQNGPARYGTPPAQGDILSTDYRSTAAPRARILSSDRVSATPASYQAAASSPAHYATGRATTERGTVEKAGAPLRPEMQKALQRLSEMPPFAREREIETGRYSQFSSAEKQILRNGE